MINFGQTPQRSGTWTWLKVLIASKSLRLQYEENDQLYLVYGYDSPEVCTTTIWKGEVPSAVVENGYSQAQNDADKAEFLAVYAPYANRSNIPLTLDGLPRNSAEKSSTLSTTIFSHNWADRTTWYQDAVRVVDEVAVNSGNDTTYTLAHQFVIDTYHGKITSEDFLLDANGFSYRVAVTVNDVPKTEQDPHLGAGGDFTVNYDAGSITFLAPLVNTDVVKATYHYEDGSTFTIAPIAGKQLALDFVECQFSADIDLTDSIVFQPYGYVDAFAPQLMPGIPSGTKIPLGDPVVYKTMRDFMNDSVRSYPKYPALGGPSWRGVSQDVIVMDWDYVRAKLLKSSAGMEIRISLQHDTSFNGDYATATFYCAVEADTP